MRTYVTFGGNHTHSVNGQTLDRNCVAVLESESAQAGRARAFETFGDKFCFEYPEEHWDEAKLVYFPRGYIYLDGKEVNPK